MVESRVKLVRMLGERVMSRGEGKRKGVDVLWRMVEGRERKEL